MTITVSLIVAWLLIGVVIGGLARLLVPGRQHMGLILTASSASWPPCWAGSSPPPSSVRAYREHFIVALVAAALLVSAFSTRGYGRYRRRRRQLRWHW